MILDEVQREPELILAIKRAVDEERGRMPGRFVLTGSANLLLMQRISETLAGRATYVTLWPFTRREKLGLGTAGIWSEFFDRQSGDWPRTGARPASAAGSLARRSTGRRISDAFYET